VKRALAALRVGAVEIGRNSVFHAAEAQDLETVLTAILSPSREPLLRAALATDLLGCTVSEIEAISGDEARLMDRCASSRSIASSGSRKASASCTAGF